MVAKSYDNPVPGLLSSRLMTWNCCWLAKVNCSVTTASVVFDMADNALLHAQASGHNRISLSAHAA